MLTFNQTLFVLIVLFTHWFADFFLQTDWQAKNKSTNNNALFQHVSSYSIVWLIVSFFIFYVYYRYEIIVLLIMTFTFTVITFLCHFITDYFTSKLNSYLYKNGDIHNFYVSIGFDQWLHYFQLFFTFYLLSI